MPGSEWESSWHARERKEFLEDPVKWLTESFRRIGSWQEGQTEQTKAYVQNAAELLSRRLTQTRDSILLLLSTVTMIALASARIWMGSGLVVLIVIRVWWRGRERWKHVWRLERFRKRFRELLEAAETGFGEMLDEDKKFLRKYEDSILYPLAVPEEERERPGLGELEHIDTLYREYCHSFDHHHLERVWWREDFYLEWEKNHLKDCKLCQTARWLREHIEAAISRFETEIATWRQTLVDRIDRSNPEGAIAVKELLEHFRYWYGPVDAGTELVELIKRQREKDRWTFDHADKVLDACRGDDSLNERRDKLSRAMEEAAAHAGLLDEWKHYAELKEGHASLEGTIRSVRQIIGRRKPEVMFRELAENLHRLHGLGSLKSYGYDGELVVRQITAAQKFLAKESWRWDKCYQKELEAARSFAGMEKAARSLRNKEVPR